MPMCTIFPRELIMQSKWCNNDMFFKAMQIHAVCLDAGIDQDKTRLLTYMHFKISMNGNNSDYFDSGNEQDTLSIQILLGNQTVFESAAGDEKKTHGPIDAFIIGHAQETAETIKNLDAAFRNDHGMENRISSELRYRLRLYHDETFRKEMLHLYTNIVQPRLELYEMATIRRAFRQASAREALSEQ